MASFAVVHGRLTKDPQVYKTQSGVSVLNLTIASDAYRGKQKVTDWIKAVVFNHDADFLQSYAKKGSTVYIQGELATKQWQDKQGFRHEDTYISANKVELEKAEKRSEPVQEVKPEQSPDASLYNADDVDDSQLPF